MDKCNLRKEVNIIVAAGKDGAIGKAGNLIWRIPADLRRFKALTMGHPVIMGRKTWDSLPKRPLPGRRNIVVTRNAAFEAPGAEIATSPKEALELCYGKHSSDLKGICPKEDNGKKVCAIPFVMGGENIYKAFMPLATRVYLTEVDGECPEADARLPFPLNPDEWKPEEVEATEVTPEGVSYRYVTYKRNRI
ncbi:MAG: dihydrofolate reductase [Muribaculaceae bacterium]|nr:dihydrofolate reductase [Muribaculaceae bacterium]